MLIREKRNTCLFSDLKCGDVFETSVIGKICMKIESVEGFAENGYYNAVNLESGELDTFIEDAKIIPVEGEFVVNR